MYKRHLELYIGKCAEWWVLIPLEQQVIQHQLICTPYIPDKMERGQEFEVYLQMHADLSGMETVSKKHPSIGINCCSLLLTISYLRLLRDVSPVPTGFFRQSDFCFRGNPSYCYALNQRLHETVMEL